MIYCVGICVLAFVFGICVLQTGENSNHLFSVGEGMKDRDEEGGRENKIQNTLFAYVAFPFFLSQLLRRILID